MVAEVKMKWSISSSRPPPKVVGKVITPEDQKRLSEETVKQLAA